MAPNLRLRPGRPEDAPELGRICYEAFTSVARQHGYASTWDSAERATEGMVALLAHPRFTSVVAESDGVVVGSNFLDERCVITGIGPITVDPRHQDHRIGRELMLAVMRRSAEIGAKGTRLVQVAYHTRSLALYAKLGFEVREPLTSFIGRSPRGRVEGRAVRAATEADLPACNRLCERVHGHDRGGALEDAIRQGTALVVEHEGQIAGYSTAVAWSGHSVGEANEDLIALIGHVCELGRNGILVPARNAALVRWCLDRGLTIFQQMTLMTMGMYREPQGAYLPSILF